MPLNPPENTPRITPYLLYENVAAAIDWLGAAFGFRERMRIPGPGGKVAHAEMVLADGLVMMGCPGPEYRNPARLGQITQHLYVYVDGVDAHFERAKKAGAKIVEEPKDQFYGDRRYGAEDLEGHCWYFAEHVRDVSPEEMKAAAQS
jgi:PhnB protein